MIVEYNQFIELTIEYQRLILLNQNHMTEMKSVFLAEIDQKIFKKNKKKHFRMKKNLKWFNSWCKKNLLGNKTKVNIKYYYELFHISISSSIVKFTFQSIFTTRTRLFILNFYARISSGSKTLFHSTHYLLLHS